MYERIARDWGCDPLTTVKRIQNRLADLTMLGFLDRPEQNVGRAGGVHYRYELALDPEVILEIHELTENQP